MSMTLNGTSGLVFPDSSTQNTAATGFGFKNRIINGAMMIDQRNAGASVTVTSSALYCVDRWRSFEDTDGGATVQRVADAPSGFSYSLKWTTTTADATLAAGQYTGIDQLIEGFNTADLAFGTASASPVTLSFWVKSSLTGTFGGALANGAFNRSYPFTYIINSANTWEQKTITIAGDTSGTWVGATNGIGLYVQFGMGVGSTYSGTAGAWASAGYITATGATSVIGTLNATWQVTGVQLEKGSTATSFDYRPYGTELALCQRYCMRFFGSQLYEVAPSTFVSYSSTNAQGQVTFPVTMRSTPTYSFSTMKYTDVSTINNSVSASSLITNTSGTQAAWIDVTSTGMTTSRAGMVAANNSTSAYMIFSAEL